MILCRKPAALILLATALLPLTGCSRPAAPGSAPARIFGERGSELPGQFERPRAVAVAPRDSRLAVIDRSGRVQIFGGDGGFLRQWRLPDVEKGTPTGCCIDAENRLIIADTHYHRILIYSLEGAELGRFGEYGDRPEQMVYPTDVARDAAGNFYITEYGFDDRILKYSPAGKYLKHWGRKGPKPGELERAMSLAVFGERLYVADSCNHRVQVFDLEGRWLGMFGEIGARPGQFRYPYDLACDERGLLYVCEYGNHRVQQLTADGTVRAQWGGAPGREPGRFLAPWGCAWDPRGHLVVADTMNFRIQIF